VGLSRGAAQLIQRRVAAAYPRRLLPHQKDTDAWTQQEL